MLRPDKYARHVMIKQPTIIPGSEGTVNTEAAVGVASLLPATAVLLPGTIAVPTVTIGQVLHPVLQKRTTSTSIPVISMPPTTMGRLLTPVPSSSSNNQYQDRLLTDLFAAYYKARENKRNTYSQVRFERDLSFNLVDLYDDILSGTYKVGRSMCFIVNQPVKREVFAASFRDRIVHHLVFNYIAPIFERTFIEDSYSCRVGKGTLKGQERLEEQIRMASKEYTRPCWVLKLDLKGYFMSINRQLLYDIIMKELSARVEEKDRMYYTIVHLVKLIIFNDPTKGCYMKGKKEDWRGLPADKSLFTTREGCGLPIGNLTSQLFSNIYLNAFDHFVKEDLGIHYYGRYVDDFYMVGMDRDSLLSCIPKIRKYLRQNLQVNLHPGKIHFQLQEKGVKFLGCIVKNGYRFLSQRSKGLMLNNITEALAKEQNPYIIQSKLNSYRGYLSHMNESFDGYLNPRKSPRHSDFRKVRNAVIILYREGNGYVAYASSARMLCAILEYTVPDDTDTVRLSREQAESLPLKQAAPAVYYFTLSTGLL